MIVEDQFTISKEEAQQLVTSFQQMQQSLKVTEEEVRRGERSSPRWCRAWTTASSPPTSTADSSP